MKVLFDSQIFVLQKAGGISRYFCELAIALDQLERGSSVILAPFNHNQHLAEVPEYLKLKVSYLRQILFKNRFWNQEELLIARFTKKYLRRNPSTILHETYYTQRTPGKFKRVITIHDMIHELFETPSADEKRVLALRRRAIEEADQIIVVSENTKKDLLRFYPNAKDKTTVVYHGIRPVAPVIGFKAHTKPYMLFVGNRSWYKNFDRLLSVYGTASEINEKMDLICFGSSPFNEGELKQMQEYGLINKVHHRQGTDQELANFYNQAVLLAYVSEYEGFGMPVLEAMAAHCPVLCSNKSSLPEVAGDAACLVDVKNNHEIMAGILKISKDESYRQTLIDRGSQHFGKFTWQKTAIETLAVYQSMF